METPEEGVARWAGENAQREQTQQVLFKKLAESSQQAATSTYSRLVGWLVAGNVAGLYFVLDRASKNELSALVTLQSIYGVFFVGAVCGVMGLVGNLVVHSRTHQVLRNIVVAHHELKLSSQALGPYASLVARLRKLDRAGELFNFLHVLSGACLGIGLASPLWLFSSGTPT